MTTAWLKANLVDLSPLASLLLHEPLVDGGHDLVELLAVGGRAERRTRVSSLVRAEDDGEQERKLTS